MTHEIIHHIPELKNISCGIAHIFILHTSASLALNENADPTVRIDLENYFNRSVPESDFELFQHRQEGTDDMTSHIKASIIGSSVIVPITDGALRLGTWQEIYLCEHRNIASSRRIFATLIGE